MVPTAVPKSGPNPNCNGFYHVLVDQNGLDERYAMSVIKVMAASTEFNWLNRRLIIGTLQSARPKLNAVIVLGWIADQK